MVKGEAGCHTISEVLRVTQEEEAVLNKPLPEYLYKATMLSGQTVEGSMEGVNEEMVVKSLHQLGYIPIRNHHAQEKGPEGRSFSFSPSGLGVKNLMIFTQELSTSFRGLSIDRSLKILGDLTENNKLKEVVQDVLKGSRGKFSGRGPWEPSEDLLETLHQHGQPGNRAFFGDDSLPLRSTLKAQRRSKIRIVLP